MKTKSGKNSNQNQSELSLDQSALTELFIDELKDIYWAEKHLAKSLPKLAKAATTDELRSAMEQHTTETENQIARLEQVFELMGKKATAKKCEAMEGLIEEAVEMVGETESGTLTRDVAIISRAQKVEHYEIASYGTLKTLAGHLGLNEVVSILEETLQEEKKTDVMLTEIAEGYINESATQEQK